MMVPELMLVGGFALWTVIMLYLIVIRGGAHRPLLDALLLVVALAAACSTLYGAACMGKAHAEGLIDKHRYTSVSIPLPEPTAPEPAWSEREVQCLARMVYGEARGEPVAGQVAVAATAVARSLHPGWPSDLCAVVSAPNQYGGYQARLDRKEARAWAKAQEIAVKTTTGFQTLPVQYRTCYFFHEKSAKPFTFAKVQGKIGNHIFYTLRT